MRMRTHDAAGNARGQSFGTYKTHDGKFVDSTGAFLVGELERLDQTLHMPLVSVTWGRDIDLREDVTIADEVSSFTNSTFAAPSGTGVGTINWLGKNTDAISGPSVDIGKSTTQLNLWGAELRYTIPELESAIRLGRPVDQQKFEALRLKHQMDIDRVVYLGDTSVNSVGLVNNTTAVTPYNVPTGAAGQTQWIGSSGYAGKSPDEILADVNGLLATVWQNAGWAIIPDQLRVPPAQYNALVTTKVSTAGNMSVLKFLEENNLAAQKGQRLNIQPLKWLIGEGVGGTPQTLGTVDRMIAYTKDIDRVRFPMTLLQRTPIDYRSIFHIMTYFCRLGAVEFVYPETIGYADGI